jgi:hypothetical protein|tara:strand:+ start:280 stop:528 length:249 start_codon:yes stop_codon:yes gene_type:complete
MTTKKYNLLKARCEAAESKLNVATQELELELQMHFDKEITVLHQSGDGFVVCEDSENFQSAPANYPIDEVFRNIQSNKNFYK